MRDLAVSLEYALSGDYTIDEKAFANQLSNALTETWNKSRLDAIEEMEWKIDKLYKEAIPEDGYFNTRAYKGYVFSWIKSTLSTMRQEKSV